MKNKKLEKLLIKGVVAGVFSALVGYVYRQGREAEDALDEKYEREYGVPKKMF